MPVSASHLVLRAKQLELAAVEHLSERVTLAGVVGELIDALQRERGSASVFVASEGQRFEVEMKASRKVSVATEAALMQLLTDEALDKQAAGPRLLSTTAAMVLHLQSLVLLRGQIDQLGLQPHQVMSAFSRVVAGCIELIVLLADAASHPSVSRQLVALVQLVQGKEAAGQERAVGASMFAGGECDAAQQVRIVKLIEAQEHALKVFEDLTDEDLREGWQAYQVSPSLANLERMRRNLCTTRSAAPLDRKLSDAWFEAASVRIGELRYCEKALLETLKQACSDLVEENAQAIRDTEGLLAQLKSTASAHTHAVGQFFDPAVQPADVPVLPVHAEGVGAGLMANAAELVKVSSLEEMLQAQTQRLSEMEVELAKARRALHERKVIERAKGALMSRMGLTEDAAFRALQKTSMDHNRRLVDVAEAALALPDLVFAAPSGAKV